MLKGIFQDFHCLKKLQPCTISVMLLSILFYILSMQHRYEIFNKAAQPRALIKHLRVQQLFTFPFQHLGLGHLVFSLISFYYFSIQIEQKKGAFKYILSFVSLNLVICLLSTFSLYFIGVTWRSYYTFCMLYPISGLWPITMVHMIEVFSDYPEAYTDFMFFPFQVKAKWIPIWYFVAWLFLFQYVLEIGVGIMVGYVCKYYIDASKLGRKLRRVEFFFKLRDFVERVLRRDLSRRDPTILKEQDDS